MKPVTITLWSIHHYLSRSRQSHDLQSSQGIDSKFSLKRRHTALRTILSALWFSSLCLQCRLYFWNMTIASHPPPPVNLPLGQCLSVLLGEQTATWKPELLPAPDLPGASCVPLHISSGRTPPFFLLLALSLPPQGLTCTLLCSREQPNARA